MTRFKNLPTEFKFNPLHHSAKNSSIKKWNNKDGELAQLTELSLVLSDQCCMEIQNFTFIDLVLPYFMSQLYSWLNMSKCLSFKEWITTKLCWSAFQLVLQMLQNTACLVFNQPKRAAAPRTAPYYTTCSKCMFPPLSTIIEVWYLVIPSQPGTQRPLLSLCCDLLHDNQSKHSFRPHQKYFCRKDFQILTGMNWNKAVQPKSTTYMWNKVTSCSKCLSLIDVNVTTVSFIFSDDKQTRQNDGVLQLATLTRNDYITGHLNTDTERCQALFILLLVIVFCFVFFFK